MRRMDLERHVRLEVRTAAVAEGDSVKQEEDSEVHVRPDIGLLSHAPYGAVEAEEVSR